MNDKLNLVTFDEDKRLRVIAPTVHMNGTGVDSLLEDMTRARGALRDALEALQAGGPNARDYYPQGDGAFERARREHVDRILRIDSVMQEVAALELRLADVRFERDARRAR